MNAHTTNKQTIFIELTKDEAIVLFEWLSNFNEKDLQDLFIDQSEERVLWDIEASLEKTIPEILSGNYVDLLSQARKKVRDESN